VNIFVTSPDPHACALALDDLRLNKMIVESCQILSTVLHLSGRGSSELYKPAYIRHPVVLWTASDARHYTWLVHHLEALFEERAFRFDLSEHRSLRLLPFLTQYVENLAIPEIFVNCTPYKDVLSVPLAYKMTLRDKWRQDRRSPTWSKRGPPNFFCVPSDDLSL
jgi:Pyrimidine dimer DNA glycosylase